MNIVIGQIELQVGQLDKNYQTILSCVKQAIKINADLLILPDLCLTGTPFLQVDLIADIDLYNHKIIALSEDIAIIWGNYAINNDVYYRRIFFADEKIVIDGGDDGVIQWHDKKIKTYHGLCQEFNKEETQKIDYHIFLDQSTFQVGKPLDRTTYLKEYLPNQCCIFCNSVGIYDDGTNILLVDGSSFWLQGVKLVAQAPAFETRLLQIGEIDISQESYLNALVYGLRTFNQQIFNADMNWIIGISGGLDSCISTALLQIAFGEQRVFGYYLATKYNSQKTYDNAKSLTEKLNISLRKVEIDELVASSSLLVQKSSDKPLNKLNQENIQARIRGNLLASFAANLSGVVINNGNKVEVALGYCTLYGDTIGAIAPLADLWKVELFTLAKEINEYFKQEIIPTNLIPIKLNGKLIFEFAPSAELAHQQIDPMKWGYHDLLLAYLFEHSLEQLLENYLSGDIYQDKIGEYLVAYQLDQPQLFIDDLHWVLKLIKKNVYKRIQGAPAISMSDTTFGSNQLESQFIWSNSAKVVSLEKAILAKTG